MRWRVLKSSTNTTKELQTRINENATNVAGVWWEWSAQTVVTPDLHTSAATLGSAMQSVAGNKSVLLRTSPTNTRPFRKNNELVSQQRHHVVNYRCAIPLNIRTLLMASASLSSPKRNPTEKHASCNFSCCWCSFKKRRKKESVLGGSGLRRVLGFCFVLLVFPAALQDHVSPPQTSCNLSPIHM